MARRTTSTCSRAAGRRRSWATSPSTSRATYLATDDLGSVRLATDPTNAVIGAGAYDAWGNAQPNLGGSGATLLAGLQASSPFGYAGQQYDAGPGTYAMRARTYNPATGQFASEDPQAYDPQVPVTLNPYEYAGDVPDLITDPSGQDWVALSGPPDTATDQAIRQAIEQQFVAKDTTHMSIADYQLPQLRPCRSGEREPLPAQWAGLRRDL